VLGEDLAAREAPRPSQRPDEETITAAGAKRLSQQRILKTGKELRGQPTGIVGYARER